MAVTSSAALRPIEEPRPDPGDAPERRDWRRFLGMLACPRCKGNLLEGNQALLCVNCGSNWPLVDGAPDFRPECQPECLENWQKFQSEFERESYDPKHALRDREGCREVYERLPVPIVGNFLDVGGADGTVRHFLPPNVHYLCIDPFVDTPRVALTRAGDPGFREVFPCLAEPYPFLCSLAERLPLKSRQFDWVHMRSMLDHAYDPFETLKEGYRCLRPGGHLLLGLSAHGGATRTLESGIAGILARGYRVLRYEGIVEFSARVLARLVGHRDNHLRHPSIQDLRSLLTKSGFEILWEHWTAPPYEHVVYILVRRPLQ